MARISLVDAGDADLAAQAASGDNAAFAELYRRHADTAWRVAQAVTRNPDDAADAVSDAFTRVLQALPEGRLRDGDSFRAYLLTAARRAGVDQMRRRRRQQPGGADALESLDARPASAGLPTEKLMQATDSALVASAFRGLPERWRSVLWLTEVEQIPAKEAAPLLGMSPNGVAQLAVRARNGLRERYIQAHLRSADVPSACRFTVEHLGAYVAGALAPRDLAKVDQHLAGCEPCRQRHAELEDLGSRLRRIVVPLPLGLGAAAWKAWAHNAGISLSGKVARTATWAAKAERPMAVLSAALFAAGIAGTRLVGGETAPTQQGTRPAESALASPPAVQFDNSSAGRTLSGHGLIWSPPEDLSQERRLQRDGRHPGEGDGDSTDGGNVGIPIDGDDDPIPVKPGPPPNPNPGPGPGPKPQPAAQAQITVSANGNTVSLAAGHGTGACTGATVGTQSAGPCTPPPPNSDALLTVSTHGTAVPVQVDQKVDLP